MPTDVAYPAKLAEIVELFDDLPRQDRIDLLLEFAGELPDVPAQLRGTAAADPVHECLTPVTVYTVPAAEGAEIYIEVGEEAPTIKAVASVVIQGCEGATREEILAIPGDLPVRIIGPEMVGQRRFGLAALIQHIKAAVAKMA